MHLNRLLRCAITTTLLLVLAGLVSVTATVATHKPAIVDITDANVDAVLTADSEWLVVVYGGCRGRAAHSHTMQVSTYAA